MFIIFIAVIAILLFCALLYVAVDHYWNTFISIVIVLGIPVIAVVALFILNDSHCKIYSPQTISLYSGINGSTIGGSMLLGTGTINATDYVYYWKKDGEVLTKDKVPMKYSSFIEDGNAYLLIKEYKCDSNFFFNANISAYEFHVPEGSVASIYKFY